MAGLGEELKATVMRDPAARSRLEVALTYPGFHALVLHRVAHFLWGKKLKLVARVWSALARSLTGIEILPAAVIGDYCFIGHGMGLVIGETAVIGARVTLYQGVPLGGISADNAKRHPPLEDDVIVGAGAKLLGPITVGAGGGGGGDAGGVKEGAAGGGVVGLPPPGKTPEGTPDSTSLLARVADLEARLHALEAGIGVRTVATPREEKFDA